MSWKDYAICRNGIDPDDFFENYETDPGLAQAVDSMCLSCPVLKQCYGEAVETNAWGVWGGVYFKSGTPHRQLNEHKTPDIWAKIKERTK